MKKLFLLIYSRCLTLTEHSDIIGHQKNRHCPTQKAGRFPFQKNSRFSLSRKDADKK